MALQPTIQTNNVYYTWQINITKQQAAQCPYRSFTDTGSCKIQAQPVKLKLRKLLRRLINFLDDDDDSSDSDK